MMLLTVRQKQKDFVFHSKTKCTLLTTKWVPVVEALELRLKVLLIQKCFKDSRLIIFFMKFLVSKNRFTFIKGCGPCLPVKMLSFENFSVLAQALRDFSFEEIDLTS